MKHLSLPVFVFLFAALPAHAANPLKELQSGRGGVVVEYERAVAGDEEFARFSSGQPSLPIVVSLAPGSAAEVGVVASAYAEGLRTRLPDAVLATSGNEPTAAGYLAEVGVTSASKTVEGTEEVYANRQAGTTCKAQPDGSVVCNDVGSAPISVGTRATETTEQNIKTVVRLYRVEQGGARTVVFEDAYSLSFGPEQCRNGLAAAATVATALGKDALSDQPLNIRLYSTPKLLRCERK